MASICQPLGHVEGEVVAQRSPKLSSTAKALEVRGRMHSKRFELWASVAAHAQSEFILVQLLFL